MTKKILVADDHQQVLNEVLGILKGEGYEVEGVLSGEIALKKLREKRYDLLLTDYVMERLGLDGVGLIAIVSGRNEEKARQFFDENLEGYADFTEQYKGLPMILMTKGLSDSERELMKYFGGVDAINKDKDFSTIDKSELITMVQKYIAH